MCGFKSTALKKRRLMRASEASTHWRRRPRRCECAISGTITAQTLRNAAGVSPPWLLMCFWKSIGQHWDGEEGWSLPPRP